MAKFPGPPSANELRKIKPRIKIIKAGTTCYRIYSYGGEYATQWNEFRYFGPTASRFDHHITDRNDESCIQDRGIMYLAEGEEAIPTCLAEVFQTTRIIDLSSKDPVLCSFKIKEDIHLLDLKGNFTTTIGASMAINSGPRPRARHWAQRLYDVYPEIHGIFYGSSMNGNAPAIALFERAKHTIPSHPSFHRMLSDPALTNTLIETSSIIRYKIV